MSEHMAGIATKAFAPAILDDLEPLISNLADFIKPPLEDDIALISVWKHLQSCLTLIKAIEWENVIARRELLPKIFEVLENCDAVLKYMFRDAEDATHESAELIKEHVSRYDPVHDDILSAEGHKTCNLYDEREEGPVGRLLKEFKQRRRINWEKVEGEINQVWMSLIKEEECRKLPQEVHDSLAWLQSTELEETKSLSKDEKKELRRKILAWLQAPKPRPLGLRKSRERRRAREKCIGLH